MRTFLLASILMAIVVACHAAPAAQPQKKNVRLSEDEQSLLDLINSERQRKDLPSLRANATLCEVARAHAMNMAKQRKLEHKLDNKTPPERVKDSGYKYALLSENIARGDVSLMEILQAWMKSKVHRENILEAEFTETGIGAVRDGMGEMYYTQVFAAPQK
jgi:uncharacterized protein YkwD